MLDPPLAVGNNFHPVLEPLDLGVVLLDTDLEDGGLVLDNLFALELAGELVAEFFHLHLACCLVAALLAKVLDDTLVLAGVGELGAADVEGAHTLLALDQESAKEKG